MTQLISLPDTTTLTGRAVAVRALLQGARDVVDVSVETAALVESGIRVQALLDRVADDLELAADMDVDSPEMMVEAEQIAGRLALVASDSGEVERERKLLTAPLNAVVKLINAGYQAPRAHIQAVLDPLKRKILAYHQKVRREAEETAEAERKMRELAARQATEREAAACQEAEALMVAAQAAQNAGSEITAQALAQQAAVMNDQGRADAHAAVQAMHTTIQAAPEAKAKGVRGKWKAVVTNKETLILHVAERIKAGDRSLAGLLDVNESLATKKAGVEETGFNVPGLRAEFTESLSVRKAALA